jgi:hypothetical protein
VSGLRVGVEFSFEVFKVYMIFGLHIPVGIQIQELHK